MVPEMDKGRGSWTKLVGGSCWELVCNKGKLQKMGLCIEVYSNDPGSEFLASVFSKDLIEV